MAQWNNKEEYEKWKAEKARAAKSEPVSIKESAQTQSDTKKCPYCFSEMNIKASICPSCKKKVGKADKKGIAQKHYSISAFILIIIISLFFFGIIMSQLNSSKGKKLALSTEEMPTFEIVGQDRSALSIVVPKSTTTPQLKTLVNQFRRAYRENALSKMIPPTTLGGVYGNYAIVWIFVFLTRSGRLNIS